MDFDVILGTLWDVIFEDFRTIGVSGAQGDLRVASKGRFCMILGQFWCPFWINFVTFWRWGATVKTVLPPVRESYFHSLSGCKKVLWDSALLVPAFGVTFW